MEYTREKKELSPRARELKTMKALKAKREQGMK